MGTGGGGLEQDACLRQPPLVQDGDRLAREGLDEHVG
jgi:hypothetical protein